MANTPIVVSSIADWFWELGTCHAILINLHWHVPVLSAAIPFDLKIHPDLGMGLNSHVDSVRNGDGYGLSARRAHFIAECERLGELILDAKCFRSNGDGVGC